MDKYFIYHCHTTYSKMDSTASVEGYIEKLIENGHTSVCFSEHGNVSNYIKKKQLADKAGLKYVHAVEAYMTRKLEPKVADNNHVVLIAKNYQGVLEINELVTMSYDEKHFYYRPRITYDEFLNTSDNIIRISACLGGVLNHLDENDDYYEKLLNKFDFLEIQYHNLEEQIEYNKKLAKYGKPLIAGTDTHSLDEYGAECRKILMISKQQSYGNEDSFDLVFKNKQQLIDKFREQCSLPEEVVLQAIENTNKLEDMIEPFELDYSFKYPTNYSDEVGLLREKTYAGLSDIGILDTEYDEYIDRIEDEMSSFIKVGMCGFMLYMGEIVDYCNENDIPYGAGRGSVTGSLVAYLLKITDVNPLIWGTNFSRFVNDSRISLGDIDCDFCPEDRIKVYEYIRRKSTDRNSSYIGTFGKLSTKSIIDSVGKALNIPLDDVARIKEGYEVIEKREKALIRRFENGGILEDDYEIEMSEIEKETSEYISKFDNIFYYYKGLNGVIVSEGKHACGFISSPIDIRSTVSLRYEKDKDCWVSMCDMKNIDSVNYVKFDVLSLKTLQVIKHTYKLLGKKIPRASEINWEDEDVFNSMSISNVGLFQMESDSTFAHMKKFNPRTLKELALINAFVRPSCDSFREQIINRETHKNPSETIDNILKQSYGFLVFQEQIIDFLKGACGFTGQEADNVRRFIGKKDLKSLEQWLPKIEEGYISNSDKDRDVARRECSEFMQILKDAGSYSFSYNHSIAYSMITYMTAYLRHYHPVEFVTSYLNNATDEDDIKSGTTLARTLGIKICNPTFGMSSADYRPVGNNIYKGIKSVLHVSENCSNKIDRMYDEIKDLSFPEITRALVGGEINSKQFKVLIKIDFFSRYGKSNKLFQWFTRYETYADKKQINKEGIPKGTEMIIKESIENGLEGFSEKVKIYKFEHKHLLDVMFERMPNMDFKPQDRVINQLSYLGYIQDDELLSVNVYTVKTSKSKNGSFCLRKLDGTEKWCVFEEGTEPEKGDLIFIESEIVVRNGRFKNTMIKEYSKLALDRVKRKK